MMGEDATNDTSLIYTDNTIYIHDDWHRLGMSVWTNVVTRY